MEPQLAPLASILQLNTRLVENCLAGLSDGDAIARPAGTRNHAAFLLAHLTDSRYALLALLGGPAGPNPLSRFLDAARSVEEVTELPPLGELLRSWREVSAALLARCAALTPEQLAAPAAQRYPIGDASVLGAVAFLTQHDSYHLGQLAALRRALGFPAMRYGAPAG